MLLNVEAPAPLLVPVTFAYVPAVLLAVAPMLLDNTKNAFASLPIVILFYYKSYLIITKIQKQKRILSLMVLIF